MFEFLVTTKLSDVPSDRTVIMVDGTVPGWEPRDSDYHWDHHRPGGAKCQIEEIPLGAIAGCDQEINLPSNVVFVTTLLDADACVAAAAIMLAVEYPEMVQTAIYGSNRDWLDRLNAIALDCDHLQIPDSYPHIQKYSEFAADVVAGMKENGESIIRKLELPSDRKQWTEEQRLACYSEGFKQGADALYYAVLGERPWPTAEFYWEEQNKKKQYLVTENRLSMIDGTLLINIRGWEHGYIDPRCPLRAAKELGFPAHKMSLTQRDRRNPDGVSYTLAASERDLNPIWEKLTLAEREIDPSFGSWGGRETVGGSSWNHASNLSPEQVIAIASQ